MHPVRKLPKSDRERFFELVDWLKQASRRLNSSPQGESRFDRLELQPGIDQLQHHLDRAIRWADELVMIIEEELS